MAQDVQNRYEYKSEDSLVEVTPRNITRASEEEIKAASEAKSEDICMLLMYNLPKDVTEEMIVTFFASFEKTKAVKVFLGEAGVIIQHARTATYAYVLFQGFDNANLGLLKNNEKIGDKQVTSVITTLFEAMIFGCHLQRRCDVMDHYNKVIVLRNLPVAAKYEEVRKLINPYEKWLDIYGMPVTLSYNNCGTVDRAYRVTSELAAFFIYMKKNWSYLILDGISTCVEITMASCCTSMEKDNFPPEKKKCSEARLTHMQNAVRRQLDIPNSSAMVILYNLPCDVTLVEIASIFKERVLVSERNICIAQLSLTSATVAVLFNSKEEGMLAVNNIRYFSFRGKRVTVNLISFTDE